MEDTECIEITAGDERFLNFNRRLILNAINADFSKLKHPYEDGENRMYILSKIEYTKTDADESRIKEEKFYLVNYDYSTTEINSLTAGLLHTEFNAVIIDEYEFADMKESFERDLDTFGKLLTDAANKMINRWKTILSK